MKHYFLRKNNSPQLLLIFTGWATDEFLYANFRLQGDCDICVVSDYVDAFFDLDEIRKYQSIRLFAWSLGVFMAEFVLRGQRLPLVSAVAMNGTLFPVDDERGIPTAIYDGTCRGLTQASLSKFYRRMVSIKSDFDLLAFSRPSLSIERLQQSLSFVEKLSHGRELMVADSIYKTVVIGTKDLIYPHLNMVRGWNGFADIRLIDVSHFDSDLMKKLIYGKFV